LIRKNQQTFICQIISKKKSKYFVNRKILNINAIEENNIDQQLTKIGLNTNNIDAVLMAHLHVDHTNGMRFFNKSEFFISKTELDKPYDVPLSTFPKWFKANNVVHKKTSLPFSGSYDFLREIKLISTADHSLVHQAVLLDTGDFQIVFAGDMTFSEEQLLKGQFGGIRLDLHKSKVSIKNMIDFSEETQLIYPPSHDPESETQLKKPKHNKCRTYKSKELKQHLPF